MDTTELVDRYFDMWNETDADRRRTLIAQIWTTGATYVDPRLSGKGHAGIDEMVEAVHGLYPGLVFRRLGGVDTHNGSARFAWSFGPKDGQPLVTGVDFAVIAEGRLASVTGFFEPAQQAA